MFDPKAAYRGTQAEYRRQGLVGAQVSVCEDGGVSHVVVVGGGPGGYEAALVAAQLGADVTVVDTDGIGGSAVLTDCVPSKTLIATAELMADMEEAKELGITFEGSLTTDLAQVNARVMRLAQAQSADIERRLTREGVRVVSGRGTLEGPEKVVVTPVDGGTEQTLEADAVLVATGAAPRTLESAQPDGERILTWEQVYDLDEVPSKLIVVGSGVTGAEFASAYNALGVDVTLVSSRDRVLPGEDADAAEVLEGVFTRRGMTVLSKSRMQSVTRSGDAVTVTLTDGRTVEGSHCLLALGSVPNTSGMGLEEAGVTLNDGGFVGVDRVSRTSARSVYAAGDCTGVLMLASVAAMQGRIAMWHFLGDAVAPLDLRTVSSNVFTAPEIATVGWSQKAVDAGEIEAECVTLPLSGNARAKMQGVRDGFVKLFARPGTGIVVGGVVVGPRASELIHPVAIAVAQNLTADQLAHAFTVYPSMSGSVAEAARRLHVFRT
jgi:NAD(P)H dehydrogenase (quinone)